MQNSIKVAGDQVAWQVLEVSQVFLEPSTQLLGTRVKLQSLADVICNSVYLASTKIQRELYTDHPVASSKVATKWMAKIVFGPDFAQQGNKS
jgi:hypothetical protein